jgi:hypothetical protein
LLSTTSLLHTYPNKTITIEPNRLTLSGVANDANRRPVTANVNPQNSLPTSDVYNATDLFKVQGRQAIVNTVHEWNLSLTKAEKEILCWHCRLGHAVGFKKGQFILRSGVVSKMEESRRLQTAALNSKCGEQNTDPDTKRSDLKAAITT